MRSPTHTVSRCYPTDNGWFVTVRGLPSSYPVGEKMEEGASVKIERGQAVRA